MVISFKSTLREPSNREALMWEGKRGEGMGERGRREDREEWGVSEEGKGGERERREGERESRERRKNQEEVEWGMKGGRKRVWLSSYEMANLVRLRSKLATMLFMVSKGFSCDPAIPPWPAVIPLPARACPCLTWWALLTLWQRSMSAWGRSKLIRYKFSCQSWVEIKHYCVPSSNIKCCRIHDMSTQHTWGHLEGGRATALQSEGLVGLPGFSAPWTGSKLLHF